MRSFSEAPLCGNLEIVELYLPPSIQFADGANYEGFEMGVSGAVAIDVANKQGNSMDGIGANVKSQVEGLGGKVSCKRNHSKDGRQL